METTFYYFSGTGNCLSVAKDIANTIHGKIVSIPEMTRHNTIHIDATRIIIIFPSYISPVIGVPLIVERFLRKIENIESIVMIAICTCGGYEMVNAIPALKKLQKIIKGLGGTLSEAYSVRLPMNNLDYAHIPVPIEKDTEIILKHSKKKIASICERIENGNGTKHDILKTHFNNLMKPLYTVMKGPCLNALRRYAKETNKRLHYRDLVPLTDRSIRVNGNCTGCGTCVKICPVGNIDIVNNRPVWNNMCEMCFACDEWCPESAIQHWSRGNGIKYHHPDITIQDMYGKHAERQ